MLSVDDARRLALALPEATEQDHHGRPSFRVAGRIFSTLWDEAHLNVMLDEDGRLIGDVSAFDLLVSDGSQRLGDLITSGDPLMTLRPEDDLDTVATELVESRRSSLLVVDDNDHPLGRILSDDVLDALVPGHGRLHFPRLLQ